ESEHQSRFQLGTGGLPLEQVAGDRDQDGQAKEDRENNQPQTAGLLPDREPKQRSQGRQVQPAPHRHGRQRLRSERVSGRRRSGLGHFFTRYLNTASRLSSSE